MAHGVVQNDDATLSCGIPDFYKDKTILITGGTGFVGKVLVEKLLRSCPQLRKIYLVMRAQSEAMLTERIDKYFKDSLFDMLKDTRSDFQGQVTALAGDVCKTDLGINTNLLSTVQAEVNVIFHVAATVNFNESLKAATTINIQGTENVIHFSRQVGQLDVLLYVSTTYSNYSEPYFEERIYDVPVQPRQLLNAVKADNEEFLCSVEKQMRETWPNTYTFTKAVTEKMVCDMAEGMPIAIYRPAVITPILYDPIPGWTNSYNGPMGFGIKVGLGIVHVTHMDREANSNMVPVDMVVNSMLAVARETAENRSKTVTIYNFGSADNPSEWRNYMSVMQDTNIHPFESAIWLPSIKIVRTYWVLVALMFLFHTMPAYVVDFILKIQGKNGKFIGKAQKVNQLVRVLSPFTVKNWHFYSTNINKIWNKLSAEDQKTFNFEMKSINWDTYLPLLKYGIKVFLLRQNDQNLKVVHKQQKKLYLKHQTLKCIIVCFFIAIFYYAVQFLLS